MREKYANTNSPNSPFRTQLLDALLTVEIDLLKIMDKMGLYVSGLKQCYLDLTYKNRVKTSEVWLKLATTSLKLRLKREQITLWGLTKLNKIGQ